MDSQGNGSDLNAFPFHLHVHTPLHIINANPKNMNYLDNQREAAGILRLEAAGSPYGHLAATVQHNIADLSQYIESVKNM